MTPTVPPGLDLARLKIKYEWAEQRYLESLPPEHFMESTPHATQRKITLESFDLIQVDRPDVQCFNELLVQYPRPGHDPDKPGQVVPDNMVVVYSQPIKAVGSFVIPLQPVGPYLVLEYVSKGSKRKDYDDNYAKYEQELKVPYYLLFYPDADELTLFQFLEGRYRAVRPNENGRYAIPRLELEAALHEGWVRYWFRGKLLPLPADLLQQLTATQNKLDTTQNKLDTTQNKLDETQGELISTKKALDAKQQALDAKQQALDAKQQALEAAEAENAKLREELARAKAQP